jgi:hypothetical protein
MNAAEMGSRAGLALTGLEAPVRLVDDVDAALTAHQAIVAMAAAQRFQRIADFHGNSSSGLALDYGRAMRLSMLSGNARKHGL